MLIGRQLHLGLAVGGPHPRAADLHATAAERHLTVLMAVAHRGPLPVPLAPRAHDLVDLVFEHLGQHTEPNPDRQGQKPLLRCPNQLAQRFLHALGKHSLLQDRLRDRYVATHGGSSLDLCRIAANAPKRSGHGRRDRRHPKVLRAPGQPRSPPH